MIMKLNDAPVGLFKYGNTLALKTEYYNQQHNGEYKPACYIIKSGEYFCGGVSSEVRSDDFCSNYKSLI